MKQKHIGRARSIRLTRRIKPVRTARLVKRTYRLQSVKPTKLAEPAQPTKPTRRTKLTKLAQPTKLTKQTRQTKLRGGSSPVAAVSTASLHPSSITPSTPNTSSIARPQYDRWEPGQTPQIKTAVCNNQMILSQQMYYYRLGYIQRIADLVNTKNRHKMANQEITDLNNIVVGMDRRYKESILEPTYVPVSSHMTKMPPKSASPAMLNRTYREAYF
jgi:hypothetical protein